MGNASIFKGSFVKLLKDKIEMFSEWKLITGSSDNPNATAQDARRGSLFASNSSSAPHLYVKQDDGSTTRWKRLGEESTTLANLRADNLLTADMTTGNNATFDNGGSFNGTLSRSTTSGDLIRGSAVFKWVGHATAGNNTNDFVVHSVIDIPQGSRGKYLGFSVKVKWDGTDDYMSFRVKDTTNTALLSPVGGATFKKFVPTNNEAMWLTFPTFIPASCAQVELGFQCTTGESSKTLLWDDIIVVEDPFKLAVLGTETVYSALITNGGSASITSQVGSAIASVNRSAAGIVDYTFTTGFFTQAPSVVATPRNSGAYAAVVYNLTTTGFTTRTSTTIAATNVDVDLNVTIQRQGTDYTAKKEHNGAIVSNATSINSMIRVKTLNGEGSTNTRVWRWTTVVENTGSAITLAQSSTLGDTFTIKETGIYSLSLTSIFASNTLIGVTRNSTQLTTNVNAQTDTSVPLFITYVTAGENDNGSWQGILNSGDVIRVHAFGTTTSSSEENQFTIAKIGASQVSGVPYPAVAYVKDVKAANTAGGTFTSGSWQTRTLNTVEGAPTAFVTLSSNQFTLPAGRYLLNGWAHGFIVERHKTKIRNVTDSTDDILGESAMCNNSDVSGSTSSFDGTINITTPKVFELQHRCAVTRATDGFGYPSNFGVSEVYALVKITKLS